MRNPTAAITTAPTRRSRRGAGGFTMIELMVVIAILTLIAAIVILGYNGITRSGLNNQTRMTLSNVASMLAEYDAKTGLRRYPPHSWTGNGSPPTYTAGQTQIWNDTDPSTDGAQGQIAQLAGDNASLRNTQTVFKMLAELPAAKAMIGSLPPDRTVRLPDYRESDPFNDEATVPLDSWGNPIIFVPAAGLREVTLADQPDFIITSVKVYRPGTGQGELPDDTLAPNARPFFASAGPDGSMALGDDNLYSFER